MTRVQSARRLSWAAIAAGLVLAGCGSGAAPSHRSSHAPSSRGRPIRSVPYARALPPDNGTQRCTEVYCVPQTVPQGSAGGSVPDIPVLPPPDTQRCTEVYCVTQAVPVGPANGALGTAH
jgi:hypothetical protein